jgi:hypothetical protein
MNLKKSVFSVLILLLALAVSSPAQEPGKRAAKNPPVEFIFTGGLGVTTLKSAAADHIQTGSGGLSFDLGGGLRFFNIFDFSVGAGACWLKDNNPFTNSTTGGERSSSVWPLVYYAGAGLQLPIPIRAGSGDFPVWVAFHAGTMGISAKRSISNCIDCDEEKLSLRGGTFYTPEIRLRLENGIYIGVGYTVFCACADLKSRIMLTMGGHIRD